MMDSQKNITGNPDPLARTRFAPSPTGFLHVGALRTALFAWIIAKQDNGEFILRIEDTDKKREVDGAITQIKESLKWLGLDWDEGPDIGGTSGPYLQSQRLAIYKKYARDLLANGHAYPDPFTQEQLEEFRRQSKNLGKPFLFRDYRPNLTKGDALRWDEETPLRFKVPEIKAYSWQDEVRGELSAGPEALDDFILIKADGFPTYNFAHIVDDQEMQITHVVRGEEFIASMPKFLSVYDAFGWDRPKFVTLPPVLGKNGGKKLSKRDGAISVLGYREQGYLKEALFNFLTSLGWNDGTNKDVYSIEEILDVFSIDRIQKSPARFDSDKLTWLNGNHIRRLTTEQFLEKAREFLPETAKDHSDNYLIEVLALVQERVKFLGELGGALTQFFFTDQPVNLQLIDSDKRLGSIPRKDLKNFLEQSLAVLKKSKFELDELKTVLESLVEQTGQKPGVIFSLIRVVTTWQQFSPPLADTLAVLGKDTVLRRINQSIEALADTPGN